MKAYWWAVGGGALATILILRQAVRTSPGRLMFDRIKLGLPFIGRLIRKVEMARFAHTLGTLCGSGVQILSALDITARTLTNRVIAREVDQVRDALARGSRMDAALRKGRHFPPALVNMVAVGEDTASLDAMLGRVAAAFEQETERVLGSVTRLLESTMILLLGAAVGVIVAAILLPIFQATSFVD
jgi:type II secretory pathway component PulF